MNVDHANSALATLSSSVAEQERASQRMIAEIDRGLSMIDERFTELASHGDELANHFLNSLGRARAELDALASQTGNQDSALGSLAERTSALRESIDDAPDDASISSKTPTAVPPTIQIRRNSGTSIQAS